MPPLRYTPLRALKEDWPDLLELPYKFLRIPLAAAGQIDEDYIGNAIVVMRLVGASPEIRLRLNEEGNDPIRITSEVVLPLTFKRVLIDWAAIVGGEVDILFCTVIP